MASIRNALGEEKFQTVWTEGHAASMEEAIAYALADRAGGNETDFRR